MQTCLHSFLCLLPSKRLAAIPLLGFMLLSFPGYAQFPDELPDVEGKWIFNQKASDVTDRQVEVALRAMGQNVQRRLFDRQRDRYRGGPEEQELYDRISYDTELKIEILEEKYLLTYNDNWQRTVWMGARERSVSLNALDELEDYSFAAVEEDKLVIEGHPRDGGFTVEHYSLNGEGQLVVDIYAKPGTFSEPVEIIRVYDREEL